MKLKKNLFLPFAIVFFVSLVFLSYFSSCKAQHAWKEKKRREYLSELNNYIENIKSENEKKISEFVASLTLEQKISQLFIENLEGNRAFRSYETVGAINNSDDDSPLIAGGYIFFSYNIADDRDSMKKYIKSVRDYCDKNNAIQPYLAVDQEGGFVNRLKKLNSQLPSNHEVAEKYTVEQAYILYSKQAEEMAELGFNMNLAPVIEPCTDDNRDFLGERSFGDVETVNKYALACVNGYEYNGIATVIKHFPGNANTDPHTGLPEIKLTQEKLDELTAPFFEILKYNPCAILMSHARTSAVDSRVPACLSSVWVTDILRDRCCYEGIIFSDDIFMDALAKNGYPPEKACVMAIEAGIDCIMTSEKRFGKQASVLYRKAKTDLLFAEKIEKSALRIIKYKIDAGLIDIAGLIDAGDIL